MSHPIKSPRKLIEVALPLDAINAACSKEKSIRHSHPSTVHLWWARRPLASARAVIFAQLVNDPGYQQGGGFKYGKNKKEAAIERKRLFKIIEDLVLWENTTNEEVLDRARAEILRSWEETCELNKDHPQAAELFNPQNPPLIHDPFAGGGAIPVETQRLGLRAVASDLNPVAVLINKALVEIPPNFAGLPPVCRVEAKSKAAKQLEFGKEWRHAQGLAEDVRRYGAWMQTKAEQKIGHLYPRVEITKVMASERPDLASLIGQKLPVIAWLWARTVKSPNPAFSHVDVPLASTFVLYSKEGKEAYVQPIFNGDSYRFTVRTGPPPDDVKSGTSAGKRAAFFCLMSKTPIDYAYIRSEGKAGRMGQKLLGVVAEGPKGRIYLSPSEEAETLAREAHPEWKPDMPLPDNTRDFKTPIYGLGTFGDLFTPRQLVALTTLCDLIAEARSLILSDAISAGMADDGVALESGGSGATAYADAVATYLGITLSKLTAYHCTVGIWRAPEGKSGRAFGRQAIPMVWDFPECNPFTDAGGQWIGAVEDCAKVLDTLCARERGSAAQAAAQAASGRRLPDKVVCTDPPYYDNVAYAELSDFFYVWLRRALRNVFPQLLSTIAVPKADELVASVHKHKTKEIAEKFFLEGMTAALTTIAAESRTDIPTTIFYAFKQSELTELGVASTGWETFLQALINSGFSITGTWPMRTEQSAALKTKMNSLASSIILVCRKRLSSAASISRRDFLRELNAVLPEALDEMTKGSGEERSPVAPVDLSQAIIGPGMAVFSKYAAVLEADGSAMTVRTALQLINRFLAEDDFDRDTQFCLHWFEQYGWKDGPFGEADTLSRAKGTSVQGVHEAGVVESGAGKVRLRRWQEYPSEWDPSTDTRNPIWETLHQLIRSLKTDGETKAGSLLSSVKAQAEPVRQLAYRLYTLCEREGWAEDARAYNELITSWSGIESAATAAPAEKQLSVFE